MSARARACACACVRACACARAHLLAAPGAGIRRICGDVVGGGGEREGAAAVSKREGRMVCVRALACVRACVRACARVMVSG